MLASLNPYLGAVWALGSAGILLIIQLLIADAAGIRAGHVPGVMPQLGHKDFSFRALRAHANTNESFAGFIALLLFAMLVGANPSWVNGLAWAWVACRVAHMGCYYADLRLMRSVVFGLSLAALAALFLVAVISGSN